jgi:hypothetical protein
MSICVCSGRLEREFLFLIADCRRSVIATVKTIMTDDTFIVIYLHVLTIQIHDDDDDDIDYIM